MDNTFNYRLFPDMGIKEPEPGAELLTFQELERAFRLLLDDDLSEKLCQPLLTLPVENNFTNFFIEDKTNYYAQVSSNIQAAKKNFLQMYESINRDIERATRKIVLCALATEKDLKEKLWEIGSEKVLKWDNQLSVCEEAVQLLKKLKAGPSSRSGALFPDSFWNDDLTRKLEFVDAGEIKFDTKNLTDILQSVRNFAQIEGHNDSIEAGLSNFRSIVPKFIFGSSGEGDGQFCRPWGVCSDATGRILVCDRSNNRIQIFNECGQFLLQFGKEGSNPGEFNRPSGIDVDDKCRIVVADKDNHRIQLFSYSGKYMFEFGGKGTGPGQFMYPWDVSVNRHCDIAVSDSKNHRIQLFNEMGCFINLFDAAKVGIQNPRSALKFLDSPRGIAFTQNGCLLVTDFNNHRVLLINEKFTKFRTIGSEGSITSTFFRPQGIACDRNRFAVSDCKNYRIQIFDMEGKFLKAFGCQGTEPGQFDCPQGISFHPNQNIVVVDLNNNRVQVF